MKILTLLFCLFIVGCSGAEILVAPIISGVVTWKEGEATKYYHTDSKMLYHASKRVCKKLNYEINRDDKPKRKKYFLIAGNDNKFKITITEVQKGISNVKIRIDFMGDRPYAELFYKYLDEEISVINFNQEGHPTNTLE